MNTETKEICERLVTMVKEKREENVILFGILSTEEIASGMFEDTRSKNGKKSGLY